MTSWESLRLDGSGWVWLVLDVTGATGSPDRCSRRLFPLDPATPGVSNRRRLAKPAHRYGTGKDVRAMASCSEMKAGEVYVCADCGLEIQVLKSCADSEEGACSCSEPLSCCGEPLALRK